MDIFSDEYFMKKAIQEAENAFEAGEVPVGALIVSQNKIIAKGSNQVELLNDVTAHAEIIALTSAANHLGAKYLNDCTLYVTLEPCTMCAGALYWSQIGKVVYGASDEKRGYGRLNENLLHPKTEVISGIMAEESKALLQEFFKSKR